jgi:hypothetical protein
MSKSSFKTLSAAWDEQAEGKPQTHEVVPFPRAYKPSAAKLTMAQQQYIKQCEMLEENRRKIGPVFTDLSKHDERVSDTPRVKAAREQAIALKHENIDAIFSSAFLHIAPKK